MAQEYTITKVSEQAPRQWNGEFGTTYYIKVMLEGHNKPVEIGKKDPNALKVGDKVFGDIRTSEYPSDGFKSARQFNGGAVDLTPITQKLDAIHGDLKLLMSWQRQDQKQEKEFVPDVVVEDIGDEPINLDDIPF